MVAPRSPRDPHWSGPPPGATTGREPVTSDVAVLHRSLIGVLRVLREVDRESGLSPARLSALSVLVFVGEMSQVELARIEGVSPPSMSLLVRELEAAGLVARTTDPADARRTIVSPTETGRALMLESQRRRLDWLGDAIRRLSPAAQRALATINPHLEALIAALRSTPAR